MSLDIIKSTEIIEVMENYMHVARPEPEIRDKLDIDYEILNQSIVLNEVRPMWNNPKEIIKMPYAKATFVHSKNVWKVYWMRGNLKWYPYDPRPTVKRLQDFLKLVDKDEFACFKG